jgi:hypothetical protein
MRTGSSRSNLAATTLKDGDQFRGKFSETQASADRQPAFVVPPEQRLLILTTLAGCRVTRRSDKNKDGELDPKELQFLVRSLTHPKSHPLRWPGK